MDLGRREGQARGGGAGETIMSVTVGMRRKGWNQKICSRKNLEAWMADGLVRGLNQG